MILVKYTREIISHHIGPCCVPLTSWANAMDQKAIDTERTLLAAFPSIGKILSDSHQICNIHVCVESLKVIWYSQIISRIFFFTPLAKDWLGSIEMHCNDTPWAHSTIPFIKRKRNHMRGKYYSGPDHFPTKVFISGKSFAMPLAELFHTESPHIWS